MSHKIATINISPAKKTDTASDIFIAQPDTIKESLAGKLFTLVEIGGNKLNRLKIINFLIDKINNNYYQNEKILLRDQISSLKVEHIFEAALAKTNTDFNDWLRAEKIPSSELNISIIAGIIYGQELHFTSFGRNKVFLLYKKNNSQGSVRPAEEAQENYKITELTHEDSNKTEKQNKPSKLFANVISGQIPKNSYFVVSNETLPEYISNKQLTQIITTLPPRSAVEQIKNTLSSINSYVTFLGIIIKSETLGESISKEKTNDQSTEESIIDLNRKEDQTEGLLAPSGTFNLRKRFSLPGLNLLKRNKSASRDSTISLKDKIYVKKKSWQYIKIGFIYIKNILFSIINIFFFLTKTISSKEKSKNFISGIKKTTTNIFANFYNRIIKLNKKSKFLFLTAVLFIIIFMVITGVNRTQNQKKAETENYQAIIELIEKKQNQAEASLLYSNEEGAKKLFDEITTLMSDLPQVTDKQKERYQSFKNMLENQLEITRRVVRVDDAKELASYSNLNAEANPDNIVYNPSEKNIVAADSSQQSLYIYDSTSNLITSITDLELKISSLNYPTDISEKNTLYYNNGSIISYLLDEEKLENMSVSGLKEENEVAGMATYNGRLYLLDRVNNKITRHNKTGNEFSSGFSWLNENIDLSEAVDMAIDGHVYILSKSGIVLKLLRGQLMDFNLEAIDPPLTEANSLDVSPEQKYLYVLEPKEKRLIVYDKTGQFILQYKADKFSDLKGFDIDEENQIIYILNSSSLYSFAASHFDK